jgi:3-oxoacyl-[acyl-carrier protein] reductase
VRRADAHAYSVHADFSDTKAAVPVADAVRATRLPLDVLVLNAGIAGVARLVNIAESQWDQVMTVNFRSPVRLVEELDDCMAPHGHIIAIASLVGLRGSVGLTAYAAAKGSLLGYVRDAAARLGSRGIHVNAMIPGLMRTAMMADVTQDEFSALEAENVLGHATTIAEIARMAVGIAALDGVSGQTFSCDSRLHPDGRQGVETGI